jgi:hypothetical protein
MSDRVLRMGWMMTISLTESDILVRVTLKSMWTCWLAYTHQVQ